MRVLSSSVESELPLVGLGDDQDVLMDQRQDTKFGSRYCGKPWG